MNFLSLDLITGALSFLFTLLIFSYVFGDNPAFRVGIYVFVGASAGYIASVAFWQVIYPRLIFPLMHGDLLMFIPLLLAVMILMKVSPRLAGMGRIAMSLMVGVGAAVTIAGAVSGTLIPQVMGTINAFTITSSDAGSIAETLLGGVTILAGTIFSLSYFHFGARPKADGSMHRLGLIEFMAWVGRIFIGITLGAIFAGLYAAALTALIERINSLINFIGSFL